MGGPEAQNQPYFISKCVNYNDVIIDQTMCMEQDVTLTYFNKVSECDHGDVGKAITRREPSKDSQHSGKSLTNSNTGLDCIVAPQQVSFGSTLA